MKRLFPIIFIFAGVAMAIWGYSQISEARASSSWPSTVGGITGSSMSQGRRPSQNPAGGNRLRYQAKISYQYQVNGTNYEGSKISFGDGDYSTKAPAKKLIAKYPIGKSVNVYYDPDKPKSAVLEPGLNPLLWLLPGIAVVFFTIGLMALKK